MKEQIIRNVISSAVALVMLLSPVFAGNGSAGPLPPPAARTVRNIEGWKVLVDDRLLAPPNEELGLRALKMLEAKLVDITYIVAPGPLEKLKTFAIVLDLSHGTLHNMQYHPGADWLQEHGYSTNLVKCVHIPEAKDLLNSRSINEQPMVILHELSQFCTRIGIIEAGLVYDLFLVNIPYQDPTPTMQAQWEFRESVSNHLMGAGGIIFIVGLLAAPFIWRIEKRKNY
ncbi:MAG: hypothetical protein WCO51_04030 [bacterium]